MMIIAYLSLVNIDQCVVLALTEDQVTLAYDRDERAGFFTHYVLNVSWCLSSCEL